MTILTSIQEACPALSLTPPQVVVSSPDLTAQKLLAAAYAAGDDISRRGDWSRMVRTATVTTGTLPADFQRLAPGGAVNRTAPTFKPLRGPLSSDQLRAMASFGATSVLAYAFETGQIKYSRALTGGEVIEAAYITKNWIATGAGEARRATADADTILFPDDLLTKGIIYQWRRNAGLQSADHMAEFEADLAFHLKQDRGVTV